MSVQSNNTPITVARRVCPPLSPFLCSDQFHHNFILTKIHSGSSGVVARTFARGPPDSLPSCAATQRAQRGVG